MTGYVFQGTKELLSALNDDPEGKLFSGAELKWSEDELGSLMRILGKVPEIDDNYRRTFLDALSDILVTQAYNLKFSIEKARNDPDRPFGPHDDIKLIDLALIHLTSAADSLGSLSIPYGMRAVPGEVHGRIGKSISELENARRKLREKFPGAKHGKDWFEKDQKIRLAIRIALAFRRYLKVNPTSTNNGPFYRLFFECAAYLGLAGGRWGDYYKPAFDHLGLSKTQSPPGT